MESLSQEEVNKLFSAIIAEYLPPVTEIKPSEIEKLEEFEKAMYKEQFNNSLQAYVKPLEKLVTNLLNNANKEKYSYDEAVADLSIRERVTFYSEILNKSGYTHEQLSRLVPRTKEEIDLLAKAIDSGFDDSEILDNEIRIANAQEYLNSLDETRDDGRRIA